MYLAAVALFGIPLMILFLDGIIRLVRYFGFPRFAVFLYGFYAFAVLMAWGPLLKEMFISPSMPYDAPNRFANYVALLTLPFAAFFFVFRGWNVWRNFQQKAN